jgi:hypothetical protein
VGDVKGEGEEVCVERIRLCGASLARMTDPSISRRHAFHHRCVYASRFVRHTSRRIKLFKSDAFTDGTEHHLVQRARGRSGR